MLLCPICRKACHLELLKPFKGHSLAHKIEKPRGKSCFRRGLIEQLKDVKDLGPLQPSGLSSFVSASPFCPWLHMEVPKMAALIPNLTFSHHTSSFLGSGEISLLGSPSTWSRMPHHGQGEWDDPIGLCQSGHTSGAECGSAPTHRSWLRLRDG